MAENGGIGGNGRYDVRKNRADFELHDDDYLLLTQTYLEHGSLPLGQGPYGQNDN
ncbi:MAG: hypothetical protein WA996_24350 [Candidatus Promineifilaceae bacterium]